MELKDFPKHQKRIFELTKALSNHDSVEAVALGGSWGRGTADPSSDFDIYVYLKGELPVDFRKKVLEPFTTYMEYNNQFWEPEDDGEIALGKSHKALELIYRQWAPFFETLEKIVFQHQAWNSYTTCFWDNLLHSQVLFDRNGDFSRAQERFSIPYPEGLRKAIVERGSQLLADKMPSLFYQLEKAVSRQDLVSVNHRSAELLAIFFDVLFALNRQTHPGEKRLINFTKDLELRPWEGDGPWDALFEGLYKDGCQALGILEDMLHRLFDIARAEGFDVHWKSYAQATCS